MEQALPTSTRVVVIGGGVIGCSTAYHLAKLGWSDVVLLERRQLTSGTTWHSAAQVRQLRSSRNLTSLIRYSRELYAALEAETGQATGWSQTGSLSLATSPDRLIHIHRQAALARAFGIEAEEIGVDEVRRLWPLARTDDVLGAVYSSSDGRVNPSDLCAALVKGGKAHGLQVFEDCEVTGFEFHRGRISGVKTSVGGVACEAVALCAGLWSRQLGQLAGVDVPLHACEHFYLLTKPIEGIEGHLPTLSDHDSHLYIRDDVGGLLVGCFEPRGKALPLENLPNDFAFDLLNEDWDHFEPMMAGAMQRIPALETAEVRTLLNGPESFTPDGNFLLGEAPGQGGVFVGCGMNSVGVASGGGMGRALAEWIISGEPSMDLWPVDIRRFAPGRNSLAALRERVPEVLGLHYAIAYPGRQFETSRNLRCSSLHERHLLNGAQFGQYAGWERPSWFASSDTAIDTKLTFGKPGWFERVAEEHRAARDAVALFDQSSFGKLLVQGPDAERFLQRLAANDVAVPPGRCVYSALLNRRGGYESDLTILRLGWEDFLVVTGTAQAARDAHWLRRQLADNERVGLTDVTPGLAVIALSGPNARDLLTKVSSDDFSRQGFGYFSWRTVEVAGIPLRAARLSYAGELGWELYLPSESATKVYDCLVDVGEDFGLRAAGTFALTALRIEKGYRAWGHELTPDVTPLEAGLSFAVKLETTIPFLGRDALLRQRADGLKTRLLHFTYDDQELQPLNDDPLLFDGEVVGQISSAAFGHSLGRGVAMGYARLNGRPLEALVSAGGFQVDMAGKLVSVTPSLVPPYDPQGTRLRL